MRILVFSDSHRNTRGIKKALTLHSDITHIFFLGDVIPDIEGIKEAFSDRIYHIVSGNCDFLTKYPSVNIETIENTRIFYCHGHRYSVKHTIEYIKEAARLNNCTLALFGHTHCSLTAYDDGLYIVNPGSISQPRDSTFPSYAIIDITKNGIMPSILYVK